MTRISSLGLALLLLAAAAAAEEENPVAVGKEAPDFALKDQDGKVVRLKDFRGKRNVVLAFYPKSFTGG
jgi:cytochrome oxidase Cu insertion factor (SCO1/SenC/PrrC family)